ncbi:MAG: hypothetical protein PHU47_01980 [Candidatus ainarchaeum sp.]|nr:hypothetical protein [Candidatus ainarchaeum sp.]
MNKRNMFLAIIALIFISILNPINALNFNIDSLVISTESENTYASLQYGNYYDNVSLRLGFRASDLTYGQNIPVVITPKIYGISDNGQMQYLYSAPPVYYTLYNTSTQEYYYPNIFYLQPPYTGYQVLIDAQTLVPANIYYGVNNAYVYVSGYPTYYYPAEPNDPDPSDPQYPENDCFNMSLSGQGSFYINEDQEKEYRLYIANNSSLPLTIQSVTTTNPSRLDIDDISYPHTISANQTRYAQIDLIADLVSSNYSSFFDIIVKGNYPDGTVCQKAFTVDYTINDRSSNNSGDCSDLILNDFEFTLNEFQNLTQEIRIKNESLDYEYVIDSVNIYDDSYVSTNVIDYPRRIYTNQADYLKIKFEAEDITRDLTRNLDLRVNGYLRRSGREDKRCNIRSNIKINLIDQGSVNYSPATSCSNIKIFAPNISQLENTLSNYGKDNGFFIVNNSNQKFTISYLLVNDNTSYADLKVNNYSSMIYPSATLPINFELTTTEVATTQSTNAKVEVSGRFDDGTVCNYSNINKTFTINILDSQDNYCGSVGVLSQRVNEGRSDVVLFNNTNKKFYVTNILFQEKYKLDARVDTSQHTISKNSSLSIPVSFTGDGSLQMIVSGKFEDGKACNYTQTTPGILSVSGNINNSTYNFSENNCSLDLTIPNIYEIDDAIEKYVLTVKNYSKNSGKIVIYSNGATINPAIIYLDGYDNFNQELTLSNFSNPTAVNYSVQLNNCNAFLRNTTLANKLITENRIELVSYPQKYTPVNSMIAFSVLLKNDFSENKNLLIKLGGFPNNWQTDSKNITVSSRSTESITLTGTIPQDVIGVYDGHIEVYENNLLIESKPITIDLTIKDADLSVDNKKIDSISKSNGYQLKFDLTNNTEFRKDVIISFDLDNSWVIDGEKNIELLPKEKKEIIFKLMPTTKKEDQSFRLIFKEKGTDKILLEENILLEQKKDTFGLTGFLTLGLNSWIGFLVLIIIVIIVIIYILKKKKKKKIFI